MSEARTASVLVVGIGNADRGDDAVGVRVAEQVARLGLAGVTVAYCREPIDLLLDPPEADVVVLVDAVVTGEEPGAVVVRELDERPLRRWSVATGTHSLGVGDVVELGRALDLLPQRLIVVGVEAGSFDDGAELTPAVALAVAVAVESVVTLARHPEGACDVPG